MTARLKPSELLHRDEIVAPPTLRACVDRTFELPPVLYGLTALMLFGFVTVLSLAFSKNMLVSYGVCVVFIAAFFAVPTLFARVKLNEDDREALRWHEFVDRGIATHTGHASAGEATILVLMLPFLVLCWAIAVAAIAAAV